VATESIRVVAQETLDAAETESFYRDYVTAFDHLRVHAAARQVLTRDEFVEEMADPRVIKLVARGTDGEAVGLSTLVTSLDIVPWISPEYYAARYPEQASRAAIYYVGFMVTHARRRSLSAFPLMLNAIIDRCTADHAVCLWDICAYNNDSMSLATGVASHVARVTGLRALALDTQTYYAVVFP
jgi:hypothetical protein